MWRARPVFSPFRRVINLSRDSRVPSKIALSIIRRACGRTSEGIPTPAPLELHGRVVRGVKLSNSVAPPGPLVYPHNKLQSQITESNSFGVSRGMSQFQLREKGFSDRRITAQKGEGTWGRGDFFLAWGRRGGRTGERWRTSSGSTRPGKPEVGERGGRPGRVGRRGRRV